MKYLAIHNSLQAGAALSIDNKIIGAISEERITRIKDHHTFPHESIQALLKLAKIDLTDVDKIIYGMVTSVVPEQNTLEKLLEDFELLASKSKILGTIARERISSEAAWNKKHLDELYEWAKSENVLDRLIFVDHHLSHASGAYFHSPYDDALIFTCDGKGNFKSSCIFHGDGKKIKELEFNTTFKSIGYFYGNITKALGYKSERHEGKITGLAAYGNPDNVKHITNKILYFEDGNLKLDHGSMYLPWFVEKEDLPVFYETINKYEPADVAAAAQETVEEAICEWITYSIKKYGNNQPTNICLSGGVFANVKLNQKINELANVKSLFIQPAMGDMGIPLGSLLYELSKEKSFQKKYQKTMSLGNTIQLEEHEIISLSKQFNICKINNFASDVIELIKNDKIVGLVQGRAEYGPRALCNRSIIYHCKDQTINTWLNERLNRTEFMPFAPVTTLEMAEKVFINFEKSQMAADFMTITYRVSEDFKNNCPAAVHVDGTAWPQIVRKENNIQMHELLTAFFKDTGGYALLNTSLNNHEEPIIDSLDDALTTLTSGNVDVLVLNDHIISLK